MQGSAMLGKCRRIENDEIVFIGGTVKETERIFAESLMTGIAWEI